MSQREEVIAGRYLLLDRIGTGGMGHVWRAQDERLGREVAVKQLHTRGGVGDTEADVGNQRAMREARITARLHHPHAVAVFDVVEHDGQPCLIMQYFPSRSLAEVLAERGRLPVAEVAAIGGEVASALAAAHQVGIVHRDVKPANVLIADDGTAKITDFGIAHAMGDVSLTSTGMVTGTPAYLSPEAAKGDRATPASDVFSLGSTLYAALEGEPPFGTGDNPMALLHRVASGGAVPPRQAGALTPLLLRMLAENPDDRPAMEEVVRLLTAPLEEAEGTEGAVAPTLVAVEADEPSPEGLDLLWPQGDEAPPVAPERRDAGPRRNRAVLAVLALVAAAASLAFGVQALQDDTPTTAQPDVTVTAERSAATSPSSTSRAPTSTPATSTPASPTTPTPKPPPASSNPPAPAAPTSAQLARAVEDYYALLPGDLDTAWERLTERYQSTTAKSRSSFGAFWADVDRVRATEVSGSPPGAVTATLTYDFVGGRTFVERTSFALVEDDGMLKIDRSSVLSSVQR